MKKFLCILSALAVLIISGCSSAPSEAPLFEKYVKDSTSYPVKLTFDAFIDYDCEASAVTACYYFASEDKIYCTHTENGQTENMLYDGDVM